MKIAYKSDKGQKRNWGRFLLSFSYYQKTFFEMLVDVKVKNLRHISHIIAAIRSLESVSIVDRDKG